MLLLFISLSSRYFSLKCKKCSRYSTWGIPFPFHNPSLIALPTNSSSNHPHVRAICNLFQIIAIICKFQFEIGLILYWICLPRNTHTHNSYEHISILFFTSSTFPVCVWMLFFRHLWNGKFLSPHYAPAAD